MSRNIWHRVSHNANIVLFQSLRCCRSSKSSCCGHLLKDSLCSQINAPIIRLYSIWFVFFFSPLIINCIDAKMDSSLFFHIYLNEIILMAVWSLVSHWVNWYQCVSLLLLLTFNDIMLSVDDLEPQTTKTTWLFLQTHIFVFI